MHARLCAEAGAVAVNHGRAGGLARDGAHLELGNVPCLGLRRVTDDAHRRGQLLSALLDANITVEHSEAGLYLWASRDEPCWDTVAWFAERGILVAPGEFYGAAGARHVRVALTATDERVASAVRRLAAR